ncbi:hypothetical protein KC355_g11654, partial [Hortaea werneckii]
MDQVTSTATPIISTWTGSRLVPSMASSILAHPGGGPPKTTDEAERAAYYYAKAYLQVDRLRQFRFLNPHITTFTLLLLACLLLQWPKNTNKARLTDFLAMAVCLALLSPQHIHLALLASNLSLFHLSWTLIPGPYSGKTPPNLPDWPTLLASLPQKPHPTALKESPQEDKTPSITNPSSPSTQEEEEEEEACMICWTSPLPPTPLLQLPCTHLACKPCLNLLFPRIPTNNPFTNLPANRSQASPTYTCPLCHTPLALNPLVQQTFRLQKARVAFYPVATFLYLLAIFYRFRRGEYWESFWPVPFLCLSVLLPLGGFGRRVWRDGGR